VGVVGLAPSNPAGTLGLSRRLRWPGWWNGLPSDLWRVLACWGGRLGVTLFPGKSGPAVVSFFLFVYVAIVFFWLVSSIFKSSVSIFML